MSDHSPDQAGKYTRRDMLMYAAASGVIAAPFSRAAFADTRSTAAQTQNRIVAENQHPGTTDWQLTFVRSRDYRSELIEGYCSEVSLRPGESLDIFLSAEPAAQVVVDFYRMGYYGGKGGRFMQRLGPFPVGPQFVPPIAQHRLRECQWDATTRFTIPEDWLSGVYLGKLSCEEHRYQSYIVFIVRDDREADLLFQCSDTTWQAYNKWPEDYSLYDSDDPHQPHSSRSWVSFDRPYAKYPQVVDQPLSQGSGEFLLWEFPLCFWLEEQGYDVTYCSNVDTHRDRVGLDRVGCFLSVGHDEYWTLEMFDNVKDAVDNGLSAAFLSGNSIMWAVALDPSVDVDPNLVDPRNGLTKDGYRPPSVPNPQGRPHRTMYRLGRFGGVNEDEEATGIMGPFDVDLPNENTLMGARTMYPFNGSADWIVAKEDHWIFEGTGMKNGDAIPGLVGWEHHGDPADIAGLEVVAAGTTINSGDRESTYTATVYPGGNDNWVFNAATIFWSMGLSDPPGLIPPYSHFGRPHGVDERVQRITANFLRKASIRPTGQ